MSDRGSFVTEYIGCRKCAEEAKKILVQTIPHEWHAENLSGFPPKEGEEKRELPIISGYASSMRWDGQFLDDFENWAIPELEKVICHNLRIAVITETEQRFFMAETSVVKNRYDYKVVEEQKVNG